MQTLNQDIKSGEFKQIYLLYGEEAFLKNSYKNRLKEAIIGDDTMNFARFEGKGLDVDELIRLADTMPFFAERRLILIEDSGFFKTASDALAQYLPSMPDTTILLFVETEVDKRNRLYKKVKDMGYAAELNRQDSAQLARWAGGILAREQKKITNHTMDLFLSMTGDDMENIRMELEKVISYTLGREVITDEDVLTVCTVQVTNRIFDMVAAIVNRQTRKAMDLYADLLAMKEPPMRILFLITRQFQQLMLLKQMSAEGLDRSELAKKASIPPFALGKYQAQCRKFTLADLRQAVEDCVDTEEQVKTGRMGDQLGVELLIMKYTEKNSGH